jgi:hypothetical protein
MAGLMQRLDRLEKLLDTQSGGPHDNPYRHLPDDEFYALIVLSVEGGCHDGPAGHGSVPEERYLAALERALLAEWRGLRRAHRGEQCVHGPGACSAVLTKSPRIFAVGHRGDSASPRPPASLIIAGYPSPARTRDATQESTADSPPKHRHALLHA